MQEAVNNCYVQKKSSPSVNGLASFHLQLCCPEPFPLAAQKEDQCVGGGWTDEETTTLGGRVMSSFWMVFSFFLCFPGNGVEFFFCFGGFLISGEIVTFALAVYFRKGSGCRTKHVPLVQRILPQSSSQPSF